MLDDVRLGVGASTAWASVLTAVPTFCFGTAGFVAPAVQRRLGMARAVAVSLAVLTAGLLLRVLDGPAVVLAGTLVACAGIAVGNVLIPVVIKESFPDRVGMVMGVYTAAVSGGAGIAAAATPALAAVLGDWRVTLAAWALLSAAALVLWASAARHDGEFVAPAVRKRSLSRSGLAWVVTGLFALQSLVAFTAMSWLAELFVDAGVSRTTAGLLLALVSVLGVPISLFGPPVAARMRAQSGLIVVMTATGALGVLGLLVDAAAAPLLWTVLLGAGVGGVFPLVLTVISLRTATPADAVSLSAMAQSLGYLLGAAGPLLFGLVHAMTGGWRASLVLLLAVLAAQAVLGWLAGRPRTV